MDVEIKPLASVPTHAVDTLLDAAFGADRHGRTAYRLRAGLAPLAALSLAAFRQGRLVGTLQSWPVALWADAPANGSANDLAAIPLVMVGPVAVDPAEQGRGIGRALMDALIVRADGGGSAGEADGALMMIGDPDYYGRFWHFSAEHTRGWRLPGPVERHRLLARAANGHAVPSESGEIGPDGKRALAPAAA